MATTDASPPATATTASRQSDLAQEAHHLQMEMERIMKRRRELHDEQMRLAAANTSRNQQAAASSHQEGVTPIARQSPGQSAGRARSAGRSSTHSGAAADTLVIHDPPGATPVYKIPTEKQRREQIKENIYAQMKSQMRDSWHQDPMLLSGYFQTKTNNTKASTFGRQPRFQPVVGMKTAYHLSSDMQALQSSRRKQQREVLTATSRGRYGTNVNSHWNDTRGGGAPGPGSYTPRGGVTSTPSHRY